MWECIQHDASVIITTTSTTTTHHASDTHTEGECIQRCSKLWGEGLKPEWCETTDIVYLPTFECFQM